MAIANLTQVKRLGVSPIVALLVCITSSPGQQKEMELAICAPVPTRDVASRVYQWRQLR
jgi:hypothetical protein